MQFLVELLESPVGTSSFPDFLDKIVNFHIVPSSPAGTCVVVSIFICRFIAHIDELRKFIASCLANFRVPNRPVVFLLVIGLLGWIRSCVRHHFVDIRVQLKVFKSVHRSNFCRGVVRNHGSHKSLHGMEILRINRKIIAWYYAWLDSSLNFSIPDIDQVSLRQEPMRPCPFHDKL